MPGPGLPDASAQRQAPGTETTSCCRQHEIHHLECRQRATGTAPSKPGQPDLFYNSKLNGSQHYEAGPAITFYWFFLHKKKVGLLWENRLSGNFCGAEIRSNLSGVTHDYFYYYYYD